MENGNGLIARDDMTHTNQDRRTRLGARLGGWPGAASTDHSGRRQRYDTATFITSLSARRVTPHIAADKRPTKTGKRRHSTIVGRTKRHPGYKINQRAHKRIQGNRTSTVRTARAEF
jgi:hypothetical protein